MQHKNLIDARESYSAAASLVCQVPANRKGPIDAVMRVVSQLTGGHSLLALSIKAISLPAIYGAARASVAFSLDQDAFITPAFSRVGAAIFGLLITELSHRAVRETMGAKEGRGALCIATIAGIAFTVGATLNNVFVDDDFAPMAGVCGSIAGAACLLSIGVARLARSCGQSPALNARGVLQLIVDILERKPSRKSA